MLVKCGKCICYMVKKRLNHQNSSRFQPKETIGIHQNFHRSFQYKNDYKIPGKKASGDFALYNSPMANPGCRPGTLDQSWR